MKKLTIGKYRRLQQCSTARGAISVLAMDHRTNLRRALQGEGSTQVSEEQLIDFKHDVVQCIAPSASAVLVDPEYGIANVIQSGALPGNIGLIATIDESGYNGEPTARQTSFVPGWSVAKASRMGANGIKLLVYYHPDGPTAKSIEQVVSDVAQECARYDIPFFLEPLSYSLSPLTKRLPPEERRRVVIETARRLTPLGVDVLKAEFPLDFSTDTNEAAWSQACAELTRASVTPWILLSASVAYETYLRQVTIACKEGASGVAVGRAVWSEAIAMSAQARQDFLQGQARERMVEITAVCDAHARPWTQLYEMPKPGSDWYSDYPDATAA